MEQTESKLLMATSLLSQAGTSIEAANQALQDTQLIVNGHPVGNQGVPVPQFVDQRGEMSLICSICLLGWKFEGFQEAKQRLLCEKMQMSFKKAFSCSSVTCVIMYQIPSHFEKKEKNEFEEMQS